MQLAQSLKLCANDLSLGLDLGRIRHVLVVAASAGPEMLAAGHRPIGRGLDDFDQTSARPTLMNFSRRHAHSFAGDRIRDEDHPAVGRTAEGLTAVGMPGHLQFKRLIHQ
jgi:hypothetical protein